MPVWNFIRTLSGRGELIPEPPSSKKSKKKSKEKELIKENDPETIEPENDEPVRKGKKSKKGKGKEKTVRYNKLPSEERTSKSLADAQKENEEIWRKQREKKVSSFP